MVDILSGDVRLLNHTKVMSDGLAVAWCGFTGLWTLLVSVVPLLFLPFVCLCKELLWNFSFSPVSQSFPPMLPCSFFFPLSSLLFNLQHTLMMEKQSLDMTFSYTPTFITNERKGEKNALSLICYISMSTEGEV